MAADPAARDKGALVVLNDEINSARNVTKTDALRLQTFRSRDYGQLGVVDRDRVVFFQPDHAAAQRRAASSTCRRAHRAAARGRDHGLSGRDRRFDQGRRRLTAPRASSSRPPGPARLSGTQGEGLAYAAQKGVFVVHHHAHGQRPHRPASDPLPTRMSRPPTRSSAAGSSRSRAKITSPSRRASC